MSITNIANWSEPKWVSTRNGDRVLRSINLESGSPIWGTWRNDKTAVKALRFSLGKEYNGTNWQLTHWGENESQFEQDQAGLMGLIGGAAEAELKAQQAMAIDYVSEDFAPLTTAASEKLFDWQRASCQRLVAALKNGNALDASQTGSGKTFVALAACAELGLTPFVIAPLAVLESWRRASAFMGVSLGAVTNYDKARTGKVPFMSRNDAANRRAGERTFSFHADAAIRPVVIMDECQLTKNGDKTLQGKMLIDVVNQGAKVLLISATAAKDPTEMHGVGLALGLHRGKTDYVDWMKRNGCRLGQGGFFFTKNAAAAADIMTRIHRTIFPVKGTRIRSADVPGYPENNVSAQLIENGDIVNSYKRMNSKLDDLEASVASNSIDKDTASAMGFAAVMAARKESERGKLEYIIEETKELVADGFQVAIFLNFRKHLALVRDGLKLTTAPIWGTAWVGERQELDDNGNLKTVDINGPAQKPEERQQIIDDFQAGRTKVVLVSLMAGGAGISLHDVNGIAPRQSLISPSYSAVALVQAIGRVWRAGSHSKATQRIIYAAGTIEEEIAGSVTAKIRNIEQLNDGDLLPDCLARFTGIEGFER